VLRCRKVRRLISARLDGELDERRWTAATRHLARCRGCRAFADEAARLADALNLVQAPEARWGFAGRVLAQLPDEQPAPSSIQRLVELLRPAPVGVGTAAFCLGVGAAFLLNGANGGLNGDLAASDQAITEVAGDYAAVFAEAAIEQDLRALFPDVEG